MMNKKIAVLMIAPVLLMAGSAMAEEGLAIAKRNGCLACHAVDRKVVGPAWQDVANKYKGDPNAKAAILASMNEGSRGKWGSTAMPSQKRVDAEEKNKLVDFVLSMAQ